MFAAVPAASAAPSSSASEVAHGKVAKAKKASFKSQVAVKTPGGGVTTLRIDWD